MVMVMSLVLVVCFSKRAAVVMVMVVSIGVVVLLASCIYCMGEVAQDIIYQYARE